MVAILQTIFICLLLKENVCILIQIQLKFVPKGHIDNKPVLVNWIPKAIRLYCSYKPECIVTTDPDRSV